MPTKPPAELTAAFKQLLAAWKWGYGTLPVVRTPVTMPRIATTQLTSAAQLVEQALQQAVNPPPPGPPGPPATQVATLTVSPSSVPSLFVGNSVQLVPTAKNAAGVVLTGLTFSYDVDDNSLASVTPQGVVTALAPGNPNVTVGAGSKTFTVPMTTVAAPPPPDITPATVVVSPAAPTVTVGGGTTQFTATVKNAAGDVLAGAIVSWTSSATSKLTIVSGTGVATAVAAGTSVVTATSGAAAGPATVTVVNDTTAASITVAPTSLSLTVGQPDATLVATVKNASGAIVAGATVAFSSGTPAVATVGASSGVVHAVAAGTSTITVTSAAASTTVTTAVAGDTTPNSVSISPGSANLIVNFGDLTLTATVKNAAGQTIPGATVAWTSSAPSVATVGAATGIVHPVAAGSATITATSGTKTGTATITVAIDTFPATVTVAPASFTGVAGGAQVQLSATVKNGSGNVLAPSTAPVTWSSSNTALATVGSSTGLVSPVAAGTVTITATTGNGKTGTSGGSISASAPPPPGPGYSINSPHWPHARWQWTDFGFHYRTGYNGTTYTANDPTLLADIKLKASRVDSIMGGDFRNGGDVLWTPCPNNPTILDGPYAIYMCPKVAGNAFSDSWMAVGGHAEAYAAANGGFDIEELVLHYYDGQGKNNTRKNVGTITAGNPTQLTVTAHGYATGDRIEYRHPKSVAQTPDLPDGTYIATVVDANTLSLPLTKAAASSGGTVSNQLGDGTKTFANRLQRTVSTFGNRWFTNPNTVHSGAYHAYRLSPDLTNGDFLFLDEMSSDGYADWFNSYNPLSMSLEYPMLGMTLAQQRAVVVTFANNMHADLLAIRAAYGGKRLQCNTASYLFADDRTMAAAGGACQCEQSLQSKAYGNLSASWTFYTNCISDGTMVVAVDSTFWNNPSDTPPGDNKGYGTDAHLYSGVTARFKAMTYVNYLMAMPSSAAGQALYYFDNNNGQWSQPQQNYWLKMFELLIGHPTTAKVVTTVQSNTGDGWTDTTVTPNVFKVFTDKFAYRTFDNGLIACRYQDTAYDHLGGGHNGSLSTASTYTWTLPTDALYYRALDDGSVATSPSTTVDVNRGEGVLFMKGGGSAPPPPDTTTTTVTVTPATASITVPATVTLTSTSKNAAGTVLTGKTPVWSSGTTAVATVNASTGVVSGISTGSAVITATEGGATGTATITVSVVSTLSGFPNMATGSTLVAGRDFSSKAANSTDTGTGTDTGNGKTGGSQGWDAVNEYGNTAFSIVTSEGAAPNSPPNAGKFTFSSGANGSTAAGFTFVDPPSGTWRRVYAGLDFRTDVTWDNGNGITSVLKFFFGAKELDFRIAGSGTSASLYPRIAVVSANDAAYANGTQLPLNVNGTVTITRGSYNRAEVEILANTLNAANATIKVWLNGTLVTSATGFKIDNSTVSAPVFTELQIRPVISFPTALASTQGLFLDHALVAVKTA